MKNIQLIKKIALALIGASAAVTLAHSQVAFTDINIDSVSRFNTAGMHGLGVNWIDINNDDYPDLFVVNGKDFNCSGTPIIDENGDPMQFFAHMYLNDGGNGFIKATRLLPRFADLEMMGSVFGDFDNDGDQDIYIFVGNECFNRDNSNPNSHLNEIDGGKNILLKNLWVENGGAVSFPLFVDVTQESGAEGSLPLSLPDFSDLNPNLINRYEGYATATGGLLDFNRDGHVDLFCGHWVTDWSGFQMNRDILYEANGDGTFSEVPARISGIDKREPYFDPARNLNLGLNYGPTLVFLGAHLDGDLYPDIYQGHTSILPWQQDKIYRNNAWQPGAEYFSDITSLSDETVGFDAVAIMGITVGDINLDGAWDLYMTDLRASNHPDLDDPVINALYLGNGDGSFQANSAVERGVVSNASWGCNFVDFDNDGDEDLYVSRMNMTDGDDLNELYLNDGTGFFTLLTGTGGEGPANADSRGSSFADYDRDGDLDLAVVDHGRGLLRVYRNDTVNTNNWLQLKLTGTSSNRSAIGALVHVTAGGETYMRQIIGGDSGHGQDELIVHFGLGNNTICETVEIFWPHESNLKTTLTNVASNQLLDVTEPAP